ncbi:GspH/FimT family pseudopilin [Mariprofundus sp. NF]|uniref:GspH/FimT family pseudopilin n=1 Tax=Mariprofundus sp. NF TaxID=2608716 RepID=UPI001F50AD7F|nr:GspH/FimT family pseudopilin [Mariprofundus sp. NF]
MDRMRIDPNSSGSTRLRQAGVFTPLSCSSKQRGFTLIEVMIVVVIIGVMSTIAIPAFSEWRDRQAVRSATQTLMSHLKQARVTAIAENRSVTIDFTSTTAYTYDTGACGTCRNLQMDLTQFGSAAFTAVPTDRTFNSRGTVNFGNMTLQAGAQSNQITINIVGRAYFQ